MSRATIFTGTTTFCRRAESAGSRWIRSLKIKDILTKTRPVSFEFFPPRQAEGIPAVLETLDELKQYRPDFVSVTYGAGGSTRAFTEEITLEIKRNTDVEVMAHLTCVGQNKEELDEVLSRLQEEGVENIIALRGDPPQGRHGVRPCGGRV